MKKLIIFVLLLFSFPILNINAIEEIDYTVTINEGYSYNLNNGVYSANAIYASTNRLRIYTNEIKLNADTFHHVLYWDTSNRYIGYSNSQYASIELDKYIPIEYSGGILTLPANTKFVAFMIFNGLEETISELNNNSLNDVFVTGTQLKDIQLVTNGDFEDLNSDGQPDNWSYQVATYSNGEFYFDSSIGFNVRQPNTLNIPIGTKVYVKLLSKYTIGSTGGISVNLTNSSYTEIYLIVNLTPTSTTYQLLSGISTSLTGVVTSVNILRVGGNKIIYFDELELYNISTLISNNQYSPLFQNYFSSMTDANIKSQMDYAIANYGLAFPLVDFEISQSRLDFWYNEYLTLNGLYDFTLTTTSLTLIQPSYEREEVIPVERRPIITFIDDYLDNIGANSAFGKMLIGIGFMIIFIFALALLKASKGIIMIVTTGIYILFTFLGFFPIWIFVVLLLMLIAIFIFNIKGNGGAVDE
jgi:hypothetical protein